MLLSYSGHCVSANRAKWDGHSSNQNTESIKSSVINGFPPQAALTLQSGKYKTADEYIKADESSCHQREATARWTDGRMEGEKISFALCAAILKVGVAGGFIKSS